MPRADVRPHTVGGGRLPRPRGDWQKCQVWSPLPATGDLGPGWSTSPAS